MNTPIIEVIDLTFDYPGFRALERVSMRIEPGTVTALVGPNGAGKTTLLRCIAALDTPLSGTVRVAGHDVYESPREVHELMGYLSDSFGLYSDLTVAQGLEYAARSQGLAPADVAQAVQTTAKRMDLGDKLQKLASTLSRCHAGSASAWRLARPSSIRRKCCCWTSPPAGSTLRHAARWRVCSRRCRRRA